MWPGYSSEAQAALSHCWLAMKGYTYATMMDFDEIIIPTQGDTIKDSIRVSTDRTNVVNVTMLQLQCFLSQFHAYTEYLI